MPPGGLHAWPLTLCSVQQLPRQVEVPLGSLLSVGPFFLQNTPKQAGWQCSPMPDGFAWGRRSLCLRLRPAGLR